MNLKELFILYAKTKLFDVNPLEMDLDAKEPKIEVDSSLNEEMKKAEEELLY